MKDWSILSILFSCVCNITYYLTHGVTHDFTHLTQGITHGVTHSVTHDLTHGITHDFTHVVTLDLTLSFTHSLTCGLTCCLTHSRILSIKSWHSIYDTCSYMQDSMHTTLMAELALFYFLMEIVKEYK